MSRKEEFIKKILEETGKEWIKQSELENILLTKYKKICEDMLQIPNIQDRFTEIYQRNLWLSKETKSGYGSEKENTKNLRREIPELIRKFQIKSITDAPCGDFNWMHHVISECSHVHYSGCDIVEPMIRENNQKYQKKNVNFYICNLCQDTIPDADLIIARDFIIHLSYQDIDAFLQNLAKTKFKYLLISSCNTDEENPSDITTADVRHLDVLKKPLFLQKQHIVYKLNDYNERDAGLNKVMMLFKKEHIPHGLNL